MRFATERTKTMTPRTKLDIYLSNLQTTQILAALSLLGGKTLSPEKNFTRAELLGEYERREGGEACDRVMDQLGM